MADIQYKDLSVMRRFATQLWGEIDRQRKLDEGIYMFSCSGHGGIIVDTKEQPNLLIKYPMLAKFQDTVYISSKSSKYYPSEQHFLAFEEDCNASIIEWIMPYVMKRVMSEYSSSKNFNSFEEWEKERLVKVKESLVQWNPDILKAIPKHGILSIDGNKEVPKSKTSKSTKEVKKGLKNENNNSRTSSSVVGLKNLMKLSLNINLTEKNMPAYNETTNSYILTNGFIIVDFGKKLPKDLEDYYKNQTSQNKMSMNIDQHLNRIQEEKELGNTYVKTYDINTIMQLKKVYEDKIRLTAEQTENSFPIYGKNEKTGKNIFRDITYINIQVIYNILRLLNVKEGKILFRYYSKLSGVEMKIENVHVRIFILPLRVDEKETEILNKYDNVIKELGIKETSFKISENLDFIDSKLAITISDLKRNLSPNTYDVKNDILGCLLDIQEDLNSSLGIDWERIDYKLWIYFGKEKLYIFNHDNESDEELFEKEENQNKIKENILKAKDVVYDKYIS